MLSAHCRLFLLVLAFTQAALISDARRGVGVNYGQLGDNLPSPDVAVRLLTEMKAGMVKMYDVNPKIMKALEGSEMKVTVMVPNQDIVGLASSEAAAAGWVRGNVSRWYPGVRIRTLLVGNEILSGSSNPTWAQLVPAMANLDKALVKQGLHKVKISTPLAMDMLEGGSIFPPSNSSFRLDIAASIMVPMLRLLYRTRSSLFVDAYPYFAWGNGKITALDFALFGDTATPYHDPGSGLVYHNLLDVQLDAVITAMSKLGFSDVALTISETGWPTKQDLSYRGANPYNAALYNRRLARRMSAGVGTPKRPDEPIPTFIFAFFNENLKPGPTTERNWGLLYPNGTRVYELDLTGRRPDSDYAPMPAPPSEPPVGELKVWCIANPNAPPASLGAALGYACSPGLADCTAIQPGGSCFSPNTTLSHASYAFNNYFSKFQKQQGTCDFAGSANLTTSNPSYGSCTYLPSFV